MIAQLQRFIGTGFYSGLLPKAPGTWGSIAFWPFAVLIAQHDAFFWVLGMFFIFVALHPFSYPWFERNIGEDPSCFVLDEWAGLLLAFFLLPFASLDASQTTIVALAGLILFRVFDIAKPLFINKLQDLPGWHGVLLDDVLAGIYTNICLKLLILLVFH